MSYRLMYVVIAFLLVVKSTVAAPFSRIVVFGDSLLDAGNVQAMSSGELPPWPAYYQGRWTNGPVFSDYLAERLGLPTPEASRRGGTNYAHSGAETGWDWTDESITFSVPGMGLQVDDFLANDSPTDSDLIIIYGGYNDLDPGRQTNARIPAENVIQHARTLYDAGGRHFLIPNLFPDSDPSQNSLRQSFNGWLTFGLSQLRRDYPVADFYFFNSYDFMIDLYNHRGQNGLIFTGHALNMTTGEVAANPNRYLCWDAPWCHVNTHVHELQADMIYDKNFAALPEPSSWSLLVTAMLAWRPRCKNSIAAAAKHNSFF